MENYEIKICPFCGSDALGISTSSGNNCYYKQVYCKKCHTYLIKVKFSLSGLMIYKVTTADLYHYVGKLYLTSIEKIERIDYSDWTQEREDFWKESGFSIYERAERR